MRVPSSVYSVLQHLRRAGLRPTVARIAILQVMQACPAPGIGADEAYLRLLQRGTRTSLSTVYRTFAQLHAAGLLRAQPAPAEHGSGTRPSALADAPPKGRGRTTYRAAAPCADGANGPAANAQPPPRM